MNKHEFNIEIGRLKETYGELKYPAERIRGIWDAVSVNDVSVFRSAITKLITDEIHPPMLPKIITAIIAERTKHPVYKQDNYDSSKPIDCGKCGDSGIVLAREMENGIATPYRYSFKCDCIIGERSGFEWPSWAVSNSYRFQIESYK